MEHPRTDSERGGEGDAGWISLSSAPSERKPEFAETAGKKMRIQWAGERSVQTVQKNPRKLNVKREKTQRNDYGNMKAIGK